MDSIDILFTQQNSSLETSLTGKKETSFTQVKSSLESSLTEAQSSPETLTSEAQPPLETLSSTQGKTSLETSMPVKLSEKKKENCQLIAEYILENYSQHPAIIQCFIEIIIEVMNTRDMALEYLESKHKKLDESRFVKPKKNTGWISKIIASLPYPVRENGSIVWKTLRSDDREKSVDNQNLFFDQKPDKSNKMINILSLRLWKKLVTVAFILISGILIYTLFWPLLMFIIFYYLFL